MATWRRWSAFLAAATIGLISSPIGVLSSWLHPSAIGIEWADPRHYAFPALIVGLLAGALAASRVARPWLVAMAGTALVAAAVIPTWYATRANAQSTVSNAGPGGGWLLLVQAIGVGLAVAAAATAARGDRWVLVAYLLGAAPLYHQAGSAAPKAALAIVATGAAALAMPAAQPDRGRPLRQSIAFGLVACAGAYLALEAAASIAGAFRFPSDYAAAERAYLWRGLAVVAIAGGLVAVGAVMRVWPPRLVAVAMGVGIGAGVLGFGPLSRVVIVIAVVGGGAVGWLCRPWRRFALPAALIGVGLAVWAAVQGGSSEAAQAGLLFLVAFAAASAVAPVESAEQIAAVGLLVVLAAEVTMQAVIGLHSNAAVTIGTGVTMTPPAAFSAVLWCVLLVPIGLAALVAAVGESNGTMLTDDGTQS